MAQDHFEKHDHHKGVVDWNFNMVFASEPVVLAMADAHRPLLDKPWFYNPIPKDWLHALDVQYQYA